MAAQTTGDGGSGGGCGVRCYYDLLEVGRQATDDELKKAYRRLALRWHPDKNPDRVDEATAHFRLVQKAYETLSDPQERAWYDKHRERILKGGLGRGDAYKEERLDVYQYFTSACYDDYDDSAEGYYTVYRGVFAGLAEEEIRACQGDDEPPPEFPGFGQSDSEYDSVVGPFYAHWETFFTRKSYVWVEQHDTREAPNKFVRKAMEKENRAARDAARRERNEEIRTLVAFVKKRDPRVKAERRRLEARAREVEAKAQAMAAAARRAHRETASRYQAPDWMRTGDLEKELARLETAHGASESESESDDEQPGENEMEEKAEQNSAFVEDPLSGLVCVACEKFFRTTGAKLSHDRSKRHRDRVERLRAELLGHDDDNGEAEGGASDGADDAESSESEGEGEAPQLTKKEKKKQKKKLQPPAEAATVESKAPEAAAPVDNAEDAADEAADEPEGAGGSAGVGKKPRRRKDRQRQKQQELLEQRREEAAADGGGAQVCKTCRQWFDSKNLLFKHLKDSGHAATKPGAAAAAAAAVAAAAAAAAAAGTAAPASRTEGGKKSSGKRR